MGFYYGPGSPPPDEEDEKVRFRDAISLVFAMFRVLAVPFAIIFGGMLILLALFWLFAIHILLGYAAMAIGLGALIGRAIWDSRRPKADEK